MSVNTAISAGGAPDNTASPQLGRTDGYFGGGGRVRVRTGPLVDGEGSCSLSAVNPTAGTGILGHPAPTTFDETKCVSLCPAPRREDHLSGQPALGGHRGVGRRHPDAVHADAGRGQQIHQRRDRVVHRQHEHGQPEQLRGDHHGRRRGRGKGDLEASSAGQSVVIMGANTDVVLGPVRVRLREHGAGRRAGC